MDNLTYLIYGVPILLLLVWHVMRRRRFERRSEQIRERTGRAEPASLHPIINERCIGCASCVKACPEQEHHEILGIVRGRAELINPGDCIGHGACKTACPVNAITLVFGTERRGVDIPVLTPSFETTVPGIYVAGELGGMGLIRNALEQGRQALDSIRARGGKAEGGTLDVLIVGAGPAGFAASLAAKSHNMRFVTLEQEALGGAVFQYPRGKLVMTAPAMLPIIGKVHFRQTSKEQLLEFWKEAEKKAGLKINYKERVEEIRREGSAFVVKTSKAEYKTASVLLAIGRRGTPRKLNVPGEELPKVVYRLIDPEQYKGQKVLVVGGGDSALEAAASVAESESGGVVLSYRGEAFDRAKGRNRERIEKAQAAGSLKLLLKSQVKNIDKEAVSIEHGGEVHQFDNDAVIVSAGGVLPSDFLRRVGISVETKYGTA
jgi:thioredoxin reductase (NADPH)